MGAEEPIVGQALVQLGHAVPHHVPRAVLHQEDGGSVLPHHHGDLRDVDEADAVPVLEHHAPLDGLHRGVALALRHLHRLAGPAPQPIPDAGEGLQGPLHPEGLHQVVEGVDLKGAGHVFLVGRGEHQHGARVPVLDGAGALDARHLRHLHVHQHHLRAQPVVELDELFAVLGLAHQLVALGALGQLAHHQPHARIVIGDEDSDIAHSSSNQYVVEGNREQGLGNRKSGYRAAAALPVPCFLGPVP